MVVGDGRTDGRAEVNREQTLGRKLDVLEDERSARNRGSLHGMV